MEVVDAVNVDTNITTIAPSSNLSGINAYKLKFEELTADYTRDQIYNADETGLNYKALPTNTLASLSEKYAPGHKMQKHSPYLSKADKNGEETS